MIVLRLDWMLFATTREILSGWRRDGLQTRHRDASAADHERIARNLVPAKLTVSGAYAL